MDLMVLRAVLGLDKSGYVNGLKEAESDASSAGSKLGSALSTAAKVGVAAVGAATTAVVGFGASSVKTGETFDKSMSQVYATMAEKAETIIKDGQYAGMKASEALRDFAQEMGRTTQYTASESADALNYMALAGYDATTSMQMLPNVLNLAAAGSFDLARASDMVTDTQTAFGISLERTSQMVDEMAKAASTGNTSVEQLGDAFLVVGGLAKELNGGMVTLSDGTKAEVDGIQELEIALTAMANAGMKGSSAGTHMRNMLMKLSSPTDDGTKRLEAMGVQVFDTEGKMRSLAEIFGDLGDAMGNMTQEEKIKTISDLFNARDLTSATALLSAVEQDWDAIGESILNAKGAAEEMKKTQMDNLAGDITYFQSALDGAKIAISDGITPTLRKFVQFGTKGISDMTSALKEGGVSGAMDTFKGIIANGITMLGEMIPQLVVTGGQLLLAVGQGFIEAAPQLLDAAIAGITNLTSGLQQNLPAMIEEGLQALLGFSEGLNSGAGRLIDSALELIKTLVRGLANSLPVLIKYVPQIVINIANIINKNMPKILLAGVEMIATLAKGVIKAVPELIANFPKIIEAIFSVWMAVNWIDLGLSLIKNISSGIASLSKDIPNAMKDIGQNAFEWFKAINWKTLGSDVIDLIKIGIEAVAKSIPTILKSIGTGALELFLSINWTSLGVKAVKMVAGGIADAAESVAKKLVRAGKDAISAMKDVDWWKVGKNIIKGIKNGIRDYASELVDSALDAVEDAVKAVKKWLKISSPSKRSRDEIGKWMAVGIGEGWKDYMPVDDMIDTMQDAVDDVAESVPMEIPMDDISMSMLNVPENSISQRSGAFAPVINIYGAQGQDVNDLADIIMERLTFLYDREEAAYAPA